jgi:hypothetical protein
LGGDDECQCLPGAIAVLASSLRRLIRDLSRCARHLLCIREVDFEVSVNAKRPRQRQRTL